MAALIERTQSQLPGGGSGSLSDLIVGHYRDLV